jgi:hypothetical protein
MERIFVKNILKDYFVNKTRGDNCYTITLPGYTQHKSNKKSNPFLYEAFRDRVHTPEVFNPKTSDMNFWISYGYQDTGLHYDDYDGILCLLKGHKSIVLYPPSDSVYLRPISTIPFWANDSAVRFEYNTYTFIKPLTSADLPSSRLLYESMKALGDKNAMLKISNIIHKVGLNKVVWGCKWTQGVCRWELYFYHYSDNYSRCANIPLTNTYLTNHTPQVNLYKKIQHDKDLIIHSFDIYHNLPVESYGEDIHLYYKLNTRYTLPLYGRGKTLRRNGRTVFESEYVIDNRTRFLANYDKYVNQINLKDVSTFKLLISQWVCDYICIFRKNKTDIFIMYLGIHVKDFARFLKIFEYPDSLVHHLESNIEKYKNVIHEIAIVYDIETQTPKRTAFYGLV